jgi:hypothetical protein
MSGRRNQRGRGSAYHQTANRLREKLQTRNRDDNQRGERERPPPGLRGREIGMWYAQRSKQRAQNSENYLVRFFEAWKMMNDR